MNAKKEEKRIAKMLDTMDWEEQDKTIEETSEFAVKWNENKTHFHVDIREGDDKCRFYGWYRRTPLRNEVSVHAIDIFVKHTNAKNQEQEYGLDSITYSYNPRKNIQQLNADIACAINRWLFTHLEGNIDNLTTLRQRAERPTIRIKRIGTIDAIIMKLRECRDTAISCGGTRLVQITGDTNTVPLNIVIDVTPQAIALKGKVPKLDTGMGGLMDVIRTGGDSSRSGGGVTRNVPSPENVQALAEKLKHTTDPKEQRKIRAMMRKMGHKGGARSVK